MMIRYALAVDGNIYLFNPTSGEPFTLVTAFQEARGCRNAKVMKGVVGGGWMIVVDRAGTQDDAEHVSTGHRFRRRPVTGQAVWGRTGWNRRRHYDLILSLMKPDGCIS
jgi:hypothetical protein